MKPISLSLEGRGVVIFVIAIPSQMLFAEARNLVENTIMKNDD